MKCDQAQARFLAYHDGDLSQEDEKALQVHLEACEGCKSEWKDYCATLGDVSGMFEIAPPDDFTERVKHAIGRRSRGRFFGEDRNLSLSFAIVSFVLIVLFLLAYLFIAAEREITVFSLEEDGAESTKSSE